MHRAHSLGDADIRDTSQQCRRMEFILGAFQENEPLDSPAGKLLLAQPPGERIDQKPRWETLLQKGLPSEF